MSGGMRLIFQNMRPSQSETVKEMRCRAPAPIKMQYKAGTKPRMSCWLLKRVAQDAPL